MTAQLDGQIDLFEALELAKQDKPAPCLYASPARGLAARAAELEAWAAEYGTSSAAARAHAWTVYITCPDKPTDRCQVTVLSADTANPYRGDPPVGCTHEIGRYERYRGCCLHPACNWEGDPVGDESEAAAAGLDHAWPGWRDLPVVASLPRDTAGRQGAKALAHWVETVTAVYPPGWLEAGGPIRTHRESPGNRHVPNRTPFGGYDAADSRVSRVKGDRA
jgi:hypothetical protein